jgi:glutamate carboxypeptidase
VITVARARERLELMLDDIRTLIEVESPTADLDAVRRSGEAVRAVIAARLGEDAEVGETGEVTFVRRRPAQPRVLLLGHHDTVWPAGTLAELPYSVRDGVLRGPGCVDMLAGIVQGVHALALLVEVYGRRILDEVELLLTGDEEAGSFASRELILADAQGCQAVLVLEASADGGAPKTARKGGSMYMLDIAGRAAHAGLEPERGVNAGLAMAHVVIAVAALGDPRQGTTVVPTVMSAGTTTNTVPAQARLHVDVRAWTADEQERVDRAIRAVDAVVPGAQLNVSGVPDRRPLDAGASAELYAVWCRVGDELGLAPVEGAAVGGGSDGNFTAGAGIPTLDGLGAVGGGAHARDEHVLVDWILRQTAQLAAMVATLLGTPATPP